MRITSDDIDNLIHQVESTSAEIKKCSDCLPLSVWETYSAFANIREWVIDDGSTVNSINEIISSLHSNPTKGRENGRREVLV